MAKDIFAMVTDRMIEELEKGNIPWRKPWSSAGVAVSHVTGKPYSLLNQILLEGKPGEYLTFKQATDEGGHVRKGEKGHIIVFWKFLDKKDENGEIVIGDDGKPEKVGFLRYYTVFHIDQCEGITARFTKDDDAAAPVLAPDQKAEGIVTGYVDRTGVRLVIEESNQAYYSPSLDKVVVPSIEQYESIAEYYSTLFHELTHSTGHKERLNRITNVAAFGSETYSKEELVAEMGAAMLVNYTGLESSSSFTNSAAYIQNWLTALRNDKKLIVSAAGKAEQAVKLIIGTEEETDQEEAV